MAHTVRSTRSFAAAGRRKPLATEHALQSSILEYLRLNARKDAYWFAVPNAGKRSFAQGTWMKAEGLTAGVSDLVFMLPGGKCAWLELKRSPKQRQTAEQIIFEEICKDLEHSYAVAHTFDEAIAILREWGVLPSTKEKSR